MAPQLRHRGQSLLRYLAPDEDSIRETRAAQVSSRRSRSPRLIDPLALDTASSSSSEYCIRFSGLMAAPFAQHPCLQDH